MIRLFYSASMWFAQPLLRRRLRARARAEPLYGHAVPERFGRYQPELLEIPAVANVQASGTQTAQTAQPQGPLVWVHAVSLGETRAASALVVELRKAIPGMRLLLTHGTATGRAQGRALLQNGDVQVWQPWDTPGAVRRFLDQFQPQMGLLVETEVWPNLVAACRKRGIPLCLVNARLSAKTLANAKSLAWLSVPAYRSLHAIWAQTSEDAERFAQLGAPAQAVLGNFKYDVAPDATLLARGRAWRAAQQKPVVLFASSREGEEAMLLERIGQELANRRNLSRSHAIESVADVQWLIVPRHPQRFDVVANLCHAQGLRVGRRSAWREAPAPADIWLGDSMGEMPLYFALADVALLGGSFAKLGGQNLIEAAACSCPVVMGPHTFNFAQAAQLAVAAGAAFVQDDVAHAVDQVLALLRNPAALQAARAAAEQLAHTHQGAARRTAQAVRAVLANQLTEPTAR